MTCEQDHQILSSSSMKGHNEGALCKGRCGLGMLKKAMITLVVRGVAIACEECCAAKTTVFIYMIIQT